MEKTINKNTNVYPILEFKDNAHLEAYLRWWQEKLFLNDWVINATLADRVTLPEKPDEELGGLNEYSIVHKTSYITIKRNGDLPSKDFDLSAKFCAELNLVHELLHLKMNWITPPNNHEGLFYDTMGHQAVESMAKSLIMAKYDLPFSWFYPVFDKKEGAENE